MQISAKEQIKKYMRDEALKPSSAFKMPTMRELVKRFNVSLVTVTRGVKELEAEGVIICRHGSGIVAARHCRGEVNLSGMEEPPKHGTLVLAVVDHPSDIIWNRVYITEQYARQKGYDIVNCKVNQNTKTHEIIHFAQQQNGCVGVLLMLGYMQLSAEELDSLGQFSGPVVMINSMFDYPHLPDNVYMVSPSPAEAGKLAGEYLYNQGHRKIGMIRNEPASEYSESYIKSVVDALKTAGKKTTTLHVFPSIIRNWGNSGEEARRITTEHIQTIRKEGLTALIYSSSYGAFASLPVLKDAGFKLPDDLSIMSGTDAWFCEYSEPALTTTTSDCQTLCFLSVDIIAEPKLHQQKHHQVRENLIERKSVKNLYREG